MHEPAQDARSNMATEKQERPRRRRLWLWLLAAAFGLVLVATAAVVFVVLRFTVPVTEALLSQGLGSPVAIGRLTFDPRTRLLAADEVVIGDGEDRLSAARLTAVVDARALWNREVSLVDVTLSGVSASIEIDDEYRVKVGGLPPARSEEGIEAEVLLTPPTISIDRGRVTDATITLLHAVQGKPRTLILQVGEAEVTDLSVRTDGSELHLAATLRGEADGVPLAARVGIAPEERAQSIEVELKVSGASLPLRLVEVPAMLAGLKGTLSGSLLYRADSQAQRVEVTAQVDRLRLAGAADTHFAARSVTVEGLRIDPAASLIELGKITVNTPTAAVAFTKDGLVLPLETGAAEGGEGAWKISGGTVALRGGSFTIHRGAHRYELALESGGWERIAGGSPGAIRLDARAVDGGSLALSGTLGIEPLDMDLSVTANDLALPSLSNIIPEMPLRITRGTVSGHLTLNRSLDPARVHAKIEAREVHSGPPVAERPDEVLAVHRLESELSIDANGGGVEIASLKLEYPYAMVQRSDAGVFPYSAFGNDEGTASATPREAARPSTPVRIKTLEISGGRADFVDRTVEPRYWTGLADLTVNASSVALPGPEVGKFHVTARQDEISPIEATGRADGDGWHVRADFQSVFLPTLNSYLAPLLGYKAEAGILSLEIDGRVAADTLRTKNQITLRNVSLSQTGLDIVQRETGVPLPIALALLKDRAGTISLAVPLDGDLRAGRFRIGSLVDQAISKAILGALSSPLKLLGLLFGTKGPPRALAIDPIPFAPGSGVLDAAAEVRLEQVTRILAAHTELTVVAKPEVSIEDVAMVGDDGLRSLAAERAAAVRQALVDGRIQPPLSAKRLVMVPWTPAPDGGLSERNGVYVELQLSADYGN